MGINQTATVRIVQKRFTEVFEGRFVDHVRFESDGSAFDVTLVDGYWLIGVIGTESPKLPDHVNPRHSGSADIGPTKSTEDVPI